jgi:hypothetical protein
VPGLQSWRFAAWGFACVGIALLLWLVASRLLCKSPRSRAISGKIALPIFTTAIGLLTIELMFSLFVLQTHAMGYYSLAAQRWAARYWLPTINSYGYRDYEPVWSDHALFVIGSSIAAGGGIERLEDRMSAVLGRKLGPHWTVATLAGAGWLSAKKYEHLVAFPKTPDILLVSDFVYDIDAAAAKHGLTRPEVTLRPHGFLKPLIENSSLANWIFWRIAKDATIENYWTYLQRAFADPEIFADYMQGLQQFIDYAGKNGARLYFVIWPFATTVNQDAIPRKVTAALEARGANIIDLTPVLRNRPLSEIVVNPTDSHPNARVHAQMAELIFQRLSKDGLQTWFPDTRE